MNLYTKNKTSLNILVIQTGPFPSISPHIDPPIIPPLTYHPPITPPLPAYPFHLTGPVVSYPHPLSVTLPLLPYPSPSPPSCRRGTLWQAHKGRRRQPSVKTMGGGGSTIPSLACPPPAPTRPGGHFVITCHTAAQVTHDPTPHAVCRTPTLDLALFANE